MINVPAGARILLATRPIDFRKGAHGLAALAQEILGEDPFSGTVIVYRAKRADRVKILVWDASGLVLVWKQMQQGSFRWPPIMDGALKLSSVEFAALVDGLDWSRVHETRRIHKPLGRRIGFVCDAPRPSRKPESARRYRGVARDGDGADG